VEVQRVSSTVILEAEMTQNYNITNMVRDPFNKNPDLISIIPCGSVQVTPVCDVRPPPRIR
jgi:hypothetical protein